MNYLFNILNLLLVIMIGYLGMDTLDKKNVNQAGMSPSNMQQEKEETLKDSHENILSDKIGKALSTIILKRNLFKVEIDKEKGQQSQKDEDLSLLSETLKPASLKLALWGTITVGSKFYAVIEDKTTRQQALYEEGDLIQQARIDQLLGNKVIIVYQGQRQVLDMQEETGNAENLSRTPKPVTDRTQFDGLKQIKPDEIFARMNTVKFRPHFSDGLPDGFMIYGIRSDSILRKNGLKNGDIIKEFNQKPIESVEEAKQLFNDVADFDNARITIVRRGQVEQVLLKVEN